MVIKEKRDCVITLASQEKDIFSLPTGKTRKSKSGFHFCFSFFPCAELLLIFKSQ
jgi:hypothetical protein